MNKNTVKEIKNELLNDSYYEIDHKSGLKIFVYPKENYSSAYAIFGTKYGSTDNCFKVGENGKYISVPEGIAHFLEHKLFESEERGAFERYAETGASANAYTSFDKTCYLFSCTGNFSASLEVLLDFVISPYFTVETVKKEQGIIGQEIKMTNDEPGWASLFTLLKAMYKNHPVSIDIAGTVDSIGEITAELLYDCYNAFYNLNNMALVAAGNVNVDEVLAVADKILKSAEEKKIERKFEEEPLEVVSRYAEKHLDVARPLFAIGYKEDVSGGRRTLKQSTESEIMLDIIAGKTSALYEKMLDAGLINTLFNAEYFEGLGYGAHIFSGESENPEEVRRYIDEEILRLQTNGIDEDEFERIKKKHYGKFVMGFDDVDAVANYLINDYFNGDGLFDGLKVLESITADDINRRLRESVNVNNSSMSVIKAE